MARHASVFCMLACVFALTLAARAEESVAPRDDAAVADAVERQLRQDEAVPFDDLDVHVADGIVRLTGATDHLLARDRAGRIASRVRGVRAVANEIRVEPPFERLDRDIRRHVLDALLAAPAADRAEVEVGVVDGRVALSGTADSWAEREFCEKVAKGVPGVIAVANDIEVEYEGERPDTEITAGIRSSLKWHVLIDASRIEVAVEDGEVELTGAVRSVEEKQRTTRQAWIAGVKDVDASGLAVKPWSHGGPLRQEARAPVADEKIAEAIESALELHARVLSFEIEADADEGWVTLRGTVDNLRAKSEAEETARLTAGVTGVTNQIKVRLPEERHDMEIAMDVRLALVHDPYTDRSDLDVRVRNGRVTLTGVVDSYLEHAEAIETASGIRGVRDVLPRIEVASGRDVVEPMPGFPWQRSSIVRPATTPPDHAIAHDTLTRIRWSPLLDESGIRVLVEDGVATLTGTVDSWSAYHAVARKAWEAGAAEIENNLKVK